MQTTLKTHQNTLKPLPSRFQLCCKSPQSRVSIAAKLHLLQISSRSPPDTVQRRSPHSGDCGRPLQIVSKSPSNCLQVPLQVASNSVANHLKITSQPLQSSISSRSRPDHPLIPRSVDRPIPATANRLQIPFKSPPCPPSKSPPTLSNHLQSSSQSLQISYRSRPDQLQISFKSPSQLLQIPS